MAQNITLMGANYEDVPSVTLPRTGGGTASFVDIGDTTASASDVLEGKVMYTASGTRTIGTGAIGGGVPSGGITNEVLTKVSSTDYDVTWSSIPVQSVNNQTGVIMLTASDVGALPSDTAIPSNAADVGALPSNTFIPSTASDIGAIPAPASASSDNVLAYNGSAWVADKRTVILSYGHSTWAQFLSAYNANAVIYCRASSNSNPSTGSQTRMAFMAYVSNADNPTSVEFQYYRSVNQHSITQQGDQMYVYKLDKTAGWTVTVRESYTKIVAGTGLASSYSNGVLTITNPAAVPTGGTTGQALVKTSNTNYAAVWSSIHDVPAGGSAGQILTKSSDSDYAVAWGSISQVPAIASADYGKYLHTDSSSGALEWAEVSGGGDDVFIITISGTGSLVSDRTPQEISNAYNQGKILYLKYTKYDGYIYYLQNINVESNYSRFVCDRFDTINRLIQQYSVAIFIKSGATKITAYEGYVRIPDVDANYYLEQVSFEIEFSSEDNDYVLQSNLSSADYGNGSIGFVIEGIIGGYKVATAVKHIVSNSEEPFLDKTLEFYTLNNAYSELVDTGNGEEYIGHLIFKTFVTDNGALKLRTLDIYAEIQTEFADGGWNFTITDTALMV